MVALVVAREFGRRCGNVIGLARQGNEFPETVPQTPIRLAVQRSVQAGLFVFCEEARKSGLRRLDWLDRTQWMEEKTCPKIDPYFISV